MRFRALLYKELRECMPFSIGLTLILCVLLYAIFKACEADQYVDESIYEVMGAWLIGFSIMLGIILGVCQFHTESSTRLWGFLLHRSVTRSTILISKFISAAICFIPYVILLLSFFYLCIKSESDFELRPTLPLFLKGMIYIVFGYITYLVITLAALSTAKWYTTKFLSIAFGLWTFVMLVIQWRLLGAWLVLIISASILLIQITDVFLNREFE
jgi:ABC-type transport system involved in multi-copper enzyme maturation permease subunit